MEIQLEQIGSRWGFDLVAKNGAPMMTSSRTYTRKRNAVDAARLIAGSKLKVVVKE